MINQSEAILYMDRVLPGRERMSSGELNIYYKMRRFLAYTARTIKTGDYDVSRKCFSLAGRLYELGNGVVKNAVGHIFIPAITSLLQLAGEDRLMIARLVPPAMYSNPLADAAISVMMPA